TMNAELDGTIPVRAGEELPTDPLEDYLRQQLPDASGPMTVEQFGLGHSNLTYLLRFGETELVLRRAPVGNQVTSAHDMGREFRILSKLWAVFPPAPRPVLYCEDTDILGVPFYLMERRRGIILRQKIPAGLEIDSPMARRLSTALIDNLARLHSLNYREAGL